jgi:hypothetical protein
MNSLPECIAQSLRVSKAEAHCCAQREIAAPSVFGSTMGFLGAR